MGTNIKRTSLLFGALFLATHSFAATPVEQTGIQAITYNDGVLFEVSGDMVDYQLRLSGVDNPAIEREYKASGYMFLDASDDQVGTLPDGLYKYEAISLPAVTISREDSARMKDRNALRVKTTSDPSPVSGSFRVLNGAIVDPMIAESNAGPAEGAVE